MTITRVGRVLYYDELPKDAFYAHVVVDGGSVDAYDQLAPGRRRDDLDMKALRRKLKLARFFSERFLTEKEKMCFEIIFTHNRPELAIAKKLSYTSKYKALCRVRRVVELLNHLERFFTKIDYRKVSDWILNEFGDRDLKLIELWLKKRSMVRTAEEEGVSTMLVSMKVNSVIEKLRSSGVFDLVAAADFLEGMKTYVVIGGGKE